MIVCLDHVSRICPVIAQLVERLTVVEIVLFSVWCQKSNGHRFDSGWPDNFFTLFTPWFVFFKTFACSFHSFFLRTATSIEQPHHVISYRHIKTKRPSADLITYPQTSWSHISTKLNMLIQLCIYWIKPISASTAAKTFFCVLGCTKPFCRTIDTPDLRGYGSCTRWRSLHAAHISTSVDRSRGYDPVFCYGPKERTRRRSQPSATLSSKLAGYGSVSYRNW